MMYLLRQSKTRVDKGSQNNPRELRFQNLGENCSPKDVLGGSLNIMKPKRNDTLYYNSMYVRAGGHCAD